MLNVGGSLCLNAALPMNILIAEMKARLYNAHVLSFLLALQRNVHISLWVLALCINTLTCSFCLQSLTFTPFLSETPGLISVEVMLSVFKTSTLLNS